MPDTLSDTAPPRRQLRVSQRVYTADGKDRGLAALLTCASWLLGRLPDMVLEEQRDTLARTLSEAPTIIIEVAPGIGVKVKSGDRVLVDLPVALAAQRTRGHGRWSRAD